MHSRTWFLCGRPQVKGRPVGNRVWVFPPWGQGRKQPRAGREGSGSEPPGKKRPRLGRRGSGHMVPTAGLGKARGSGVGETQT